MNEAQRLNVEEMRRLQRYRSLLNHLPTGLSLFSVVHRDLAARDNRERRGAPFDNLNADEIHRRMMEVSGPRLQCVCGKLQCRAEERGAD